MNLVFTCTVCRSQLQAPQTQAGQLVRCSTCLATLRVPTAITSPAPPVAAAVGTPVKSPPPLSSTRPDPASRSVSTATQPSSAFQTPGRTTGGRRYGFNCVYCSSRLEATEGVAGQEGQCPTCGNSIHIPILDRYGRLIDPITKEVLKQDPHPVHAYAAAGERAPNILRTDTGAQLIQCPRCNSTSPITANNCKSCGMPFTMEGTTLEATGSSNGFCVASLVLGIVGIPAGCTFIPALLAVIFGIIGLNQIAKSGGEGGGKGMAIAGIVCGAAGLLVGLLTTGILR